MNKPFSVMLGFALFSAVANAQIGSGWTQKNYAEVLDPEIDGTHHVVREVPQSYTAPGDVCSYSNINGVEEFHLASTNASRVEIRLINEYRAPAAGRQFEGDVMILPSTGHQSLMQIFGNYSHATLFMLHGSGAYHGSLRHYDREILMTNVYETWVHVNVIHMPGLYVQVYLNGEFKGQWPDDSADHPHYFKYGCYGTLDPGSAWVKWKNVKFFVGGEPPKNVEVGSAKSEGGAGG